MSKLHLVFGGRVSDPQGLDFVDLSNLDVVGLFPDYKTAEKAWRSAAQRTVDDAEMNITHVIRSQEFIASVPKYLNLYEALELEPPVLAMLPYVMGPDGNKKLSKRDGDPSYQIYLSIGQSF